MERSTCNTRIAKEVANELGLPIKTAELVIGSQSEFTKFIMENGSFDSVRWRYLGQFKSKPKEVQMLEYLKGLTKEQASEFKKAVRTGKIRLNTWEKK
jgi:hypothetical protein